MIYKVPSSQPGYACVVFELPSCVWADRIYVSGTFNHWSEHALPMVQERDGVWRARLNLPLGQRYEFRYVIDGRWQTDYHADGFTENRYGSHNSIVDLNLVMVLPATNQAGDQVPESQGHAPAHLPAPSDVAMMALRSARSSSNSNLPRLRPRVAAA